MQALVVVQSCLLENVPVLIVDTELSRGGVHQSMETGFPPTGRSPPCPLVAGTVPGTGPL